MNPARLFVAALLGAPIAASAATLSVTPDQAVYQVGDLITLNVLGDAEGESAFGVVGRLEFDAALAAAFSVSQVQLESDSGAWDTLSLPTGSGFATAFSQITQPFGTPLVPTNQLVATVVLQATGIGVLSVDWSSNLGFFGLANPRPPRSRSSPSHRPVSWSSWASLDSQPASAPGPPGRVALATAESAHSNVRPIQLDLERPDVETPAVAGEVAELPEMPPC